MDDDAASLPDWNGFSMKYWDRRGYKFYILLQIVNYFNISNLCVVTLLNFIMWFQRNNDWNWKTDMSFGLFSYFMNYFLDILFF